MIKELKKTTFKEMKEGMMIMSNSIENINTEIEMNIMKLKSIVTKMKSSLEYFNSWFEVAEQRIRKLEDRSTDIM